MKVVSTFIFLSCIVSFTTFGQHQKLILTSEQNSAWLDTLKTLELNQQLIKIGDRLLADTNIFIRKNYGDRIIANVILNNRVQGERKPLIVIGGLFLFIDNNTSPAKIIGLTKLLSPQFIKSISVLSPNDAATTALYGSAGFNGVIAMVLTQKKYLKKIEQLDLILTP